MPPRKKKSQTRLTFEPLGASTSSPASAYSPAKVRYAKTVQSSPSRRSSSRMATSSPTQATPGSSARKTRQSRLTSSQGPTAPPPASFMPKVYGTGRRTTAVDSSDESAAEIGDAGYDEDVVDRLPPTQKASKPHNSDTSSSDDLDESDDEPVIVNPRSSQSVSTRMQRAIIIDDSSDDSPVARSSPLKRRRKSVSSTDDSDDAPILLSAREARNSLDAPTKFEESDDEAISPTKRRKMAHKSSPSTPPKNRTPGKLKRPILSASSPIKKAHKGHRSEKQKKMELLRRRRAGEKIDKLTSSESSASEDEKRGIYDSDSQDEFEVLKEFDDEEGEEEVVEKKPRPTKIKPKRENASDEDEDKSDLDDFVTDDDDAPLGAPVDIPLEFTSQAHKPLKDQFPHVIEWLVHNRIDPAFERRDPVYINAWRKLDDEVSGLARSKFTSSVWRPDFNRALRGRPQLEAYELAHIGSDRLYETCEACGRSNHPSTWRLQFLGSAYHKDTLAEVESDSDSDKDEADTVSVDSQGMALPPTSKEWCVGAVCRDNAVTAHSLLHWKYALKEYVEDRLEIDGWMTDAKLREREKMKAKKRRGLANDIVDGWQRSGVISALYADFKATLENARNQSTTGRRGRGR